MGASPPVWVAEPDEAEDVAALLVAFRDHMGRDRPSENAIYAGVERLIDAPDCEYLLAAPHDDAPPAGVAQVRYRWGIWVVAPDCWLEDLFVREEARRAGLGAALVEATLRRARSYGCRRVALDTAEDNAAALALYRSFGFTTKEPGVRDLYLQVLLQDEG
jgi:GNAT superfamily N-acetyltransferase